MDPILFPILLGAVAIFITLISKIPRGWAAAIGGLMLIVLAADSIIAGLRALLR